MLASHRLSLEQKVDGGVKVREKEVGGREREQEGGDGGEGDSEEGHERKGIR